MLAYYIDAELHMANQQDYLFYLPSLKLKIEITHQIPRYTIHMWIIEPEFLNIGELKYHDYYHIPCLSWWYHIIPLSRFKDRVMLAPFTKTMHVLTRTICQVWNALGRRAMVPY
jgi:hypothetical protein